MRPKPSEHAEKELVMAKKDFIPHPDSEFLLHHNQLTTAAAAPGTIVPPADQAALANDNLRLKQDFQAA